MAPNRKKGKAMTDSSTALKRACNWMITANVNLGHALFKANTFDGNAKEIANETQIAADLRNVIRACENALRQFD